MIKKIVLAVTAVICFAASATVVEVENNSSIPNAQNLNLSGTGNVQVTGSILGSGSMGDYDYFRLGQFGIGGNVSVSTAGSNFDTYIGLYNAAGNLVIADDDSAGNLTSQFNFNVTIQDVYTLVIRGFGLGFANDPFSLTPGNGRGSEGAYTAAISYSGAQTQNVPEPGSLALLGLGLAGLAYSRKRKAQTTAA